MQSAASPRKWAGPVRWHWLARAPLLLAVVSELSLIIPTRDRASILARCLDALTAQQVDAEVEVIVVDDGSRDRTSVVLAQYPGVQAIHQQSRGGPAALNVGVAQATARVVMFLDDDAIATPGLLQRHVEFHRARPGSHEALVGPVTWAPQLEVTHHMTWLEDGGPLFAFNTISDPDDVDWRHFCTANVSVSKELLGRDPFDETLERFTDAELGYRLAQRGMRLHYDASALVHHWRVDDPPSTARRMRVVGRAARMVHLKHPEIAEPPPPFRRSAPVRAALARTAAPALPDPVRAPILERLYSYQAARAYARGYAEQERALRRGDRPGTVARRFSRARARARGPRRPRVRGKAVNR